MASLFFLCVLTVVAAAAVCVAMFVVVLWFFLLLLLLLLPSFAFMYFSTLLFLFALEGSYINRWSRYSYEISYEFTAVRIGGEMKGKLNELSQKKHMFIRYAP